MELAKLPAESRDKLVDTAAAFASNNKWIPNAGPQLDAYFSKADILLYGGAGGGGKTDLICGLALTAHQNTLILREQFNDLDAVTERAIAINGTRQGFNGSNPPSLRTSDGRFIQFSGAKKEQWQGAPFDLKCFDEVVQMAEDVVRFHIGWLRTIDPNQRTRIILATNPPTTSVGDWIIGMFAPWLDLTHPNPAKPGELRWFVKDPDGKDFEVPDGKPYLFPAQEKPVLPMSRTFLPARLADNPYLANTGYQSRLDNMDEPYRSAVRDGNFMAFRGDQDFQVIPTQWIVDAQKRWSPSVPHDFTMTAIGCDVGQGGVDRVVFAPRYGFWYAPLVTLAGKRCPDGPAQMAQLAMLRRDNAAVVVDVGGGFGGDLCSMLKMNGIPHSRFNGSEGSASRTKDGTNRSFENRRAEAWWRLREALNPDQPGGAIVALPDDPELRAELAAPTYKADILKVQLEDKKEIKKRIGRSLDKADAVVMAFGPGSRAERRQRFGGISSGGYDRPERGNLGYQDMKGGTRG